jgi:hypothetical protein
MAISLVGTTQGSASNGSGVTIDLTGISLAENDLVVVMGGFPGTGNSGVSGYTYTVTDAGASVSGSFSVCYKFMTGSPDTSVTCLGHGNTSNACAYTVMAFRGVDTTTPIDTSSISTQNASGTPNSPSITTVTDNAAVITCGISAVDDAAVTAPSGYGDKVSGNASDTFSATTMSAWKLKTPAGAENPAAWADLSSAGWIASSVALRPAASGTIEDGVFSATGTVTTSFEDGTLKVFAATGTITASFTGAPFTDAAISASGSGDASFGGESLATSGAFSISGTGTASFAGGLSGGGNIGATGTVTATFGGESIYASMAEFTASAAMVFVAADTDEFISHVSEVIESRGAVTVNIG